MAKLIRGNRKAILVQAGQQFVDVRLIPSFRPRNAPHRIDVVAGKRAIMSHFNNARALTGNRTGEVGQTARGR
jgi:hypothetical protein